MADEVGEEGSIPAKWSQPKEGRSSEQRTRNSALRRS
jgi:hypothetical protein